jgi:hypothetical protein
MSYQVLIGERKSLVFPVMCYGHLRIDYDDEVADQNYGLFNHDESITIQTILTPYDVNGYGYNLDLDNPIGKFGVTTSKKTLPAIQDKAVTFLHTDGTTTNTILAAESQREVYLSQSTALTHEMIIFYNSNIQLSLINATSTNVNQPAEYKIKLTIVANETSDSLTTTNAVITANNVVSDSGGSTIYGYDNTGAGTAYRQIGPIDTVPDMSPDPNTTFTTVVAEDEYFQVGNKLYTVSGQVFTHIATITAVTSSLVTVSLEAGQSLVDDSMLYTDVNKEANYLVTPFHISASYDNTTGYMIIYVNGTKVASKFHSTGSSPFTVEPEDSYIGAIPTVTNAGYSWLRKQFMGELHEFAIIKGTINSFITTSTLIPNYRNLLLYYRFEEVDL